MGVFLHTAVLPGCTIEDIPRKIKSKSKNGYTFDLSGGQCFAGEKGVQILFEDDEADLGPLAGALSEAVNGPALFAYIYDSDTWGYYLYDRGQEIDCFDAVPEISFLETPTEEQLTRLAGKPEVLAQYFQVTSEEIQNYLTFWTEELCKEENRAYPDDRFPYGDCWQLTDFLASLGWSWPFGTE